MSFRIKGLDSKPYHALYGLSKAELAKRGVVRYQVDNYPGFPDRITMQDASAGENVLLLNHTSQPAKTPYQASHAIFILEGAKQTYDKSDEIPQVMLNRIQSLRGFDDRGMMLDADVAEGEEDIIRVIEQLFENPNIKTIHTHNAKQGCYSGKIERA